MKKIILTLLLMPFCLTAYAAPVALVEDVSDGIEGVSLLDFVDAGKQVDLGESGFMVLGYLESCVHEQIKGGQVTIGTTESAVSAGEVKREITECDGGRLSLAANELAQSGAMAFRDINKDTQSQLTVHDVSPVVVLQKGGKVTIKRLDQTGERYRIRTERKERKFMLDLAQEGVSLQPGAKYMITVSGSSMVFDVAENAEHNAGNLMGRLLPL